MKRALFPALLFAIALTLSAGAAPPAYDHVVIVIEENHSLTQIIGNRTTAPYINQLADGGVNFTGLFSISHPSQPNYLELFSGAAQGVTDDSVPAGYPFSTPNLGAALLAAGRTFIGYSEDLTEAGDRDTASTDLVAGGTTYKLYRRKHNPWANWQDAKPSDGSVPTPPPNQLPWTTNQPFSAFPTDFTQLPDVSIVAPNEQNDMHDGTVKMADDWLAANLSAYAEWAKTHNSLLVVVWDEDDYASDNRIPTLFYGANLKPGNNDSTWTLHNLLRTIGEMYGVATHAGSAAQVEAISGVFTSDFPAVTLALRQGADGYVGAHDTELHFAQPDAVFGGATPLAADLDEDGAAGNQEVQALVRFDQVATLVPPGAHILSAKLIMHTTDVSDDVVELHRMLVDWDENSTWNSLADGVVADDIEAAATPEFSLTPNIAGANSIFDVTVAVRDWIAGVPNKGWVILPTGTDGWGFDSAEGATARFRPTLEITYAVSVLEFSATTYVRDEVPGGMVTITVTRSGCADDAVSVDYATADGTASSGEDYAASSSTLSWTAGDVTPHTFSVEITPDEIVEADETVLLALTNATGAAVLTGRATATLTIRETALNNWRVERFGADANTPEIAGDTADPDGDAQDNISEYIAGTEPLDPVSRFRASIEPGGPGEMHILFTAQPGRGYTVQFKAALSDTEWQSLTDIAPASTAREIDITDAIGSSGQHFYRVVTPMQP